MSVMQRALDTQLKNIQIKTGKSLAELGQFVQASGLTKHGQIRDLLKQEFGLGHGDANTLTHILRNPDAEQATQAKDATSEDVLSEIYSGPKATLRPIHNTLMEAIIQFGDFEISPKKAYVSLRRKKQFATIGPATKTRVDVGLNMKGVEATERLATMPAGSMCNYTVRVTDASEVDDELIAWLRTAYEHAG